MGNLINCLNSKLKVLLLSAVLCFGVLVIGQITSMPSASAEELVVTGQVTDSSNGSPIEDVTITVTLSLSVFFSTSSVTDSSGNYSLSLPVPFGGYSVSVQPGLGSGYYGKTLNNVSVTSDMVMDFQLDPVQSFDEIVVNGVVQSSYYFSPRVPLENVTVQAVSGSTVVKSAVTNSLGEYSMTLPDGQYTFKAAPETGSKYDQKSVSATLGTHPVTNISFDLDLIEIPMSIKSGTVFDTNGNPVAGATIIFDDPIGSSLWDEVAGTTDENGHYSLSMQPPVACDCYEVRIRPANTPNRTVSLAHYDKDFSGVALGRDHTEDFELDVIPPTSVLAMTVPDQMEAEVYNYDGQLLFTRTAGLYEETLNSDVYKIKLSVVGTLPPHEYGTAYDEVQEWHWVDLRTSRSWSYTPLKLSLVTGYIKDSDDLPVKGAKVKFTIPGPLGSPTMVTYTDENGNYSFAVYPYNVIGPVVTGGYSIFASGCSAMHGHDEIHDQYISFDANYDFTLTSSRQSGQVTLCGEVIDDSPSNTKTIVAYASGTTEQIASSPIDEAGRYWLVLHSGVYDITVIDATGQQVKSIEEVDVVVDKLFDISLSEYTDSTSPEIIYNISSEPNAAGWYNAPVTLTWNVTDGESQVETNSCDETVVSQNGEYTFTCTATSAGGTATESITIKYDASAPQNFAFLSPANGATVSGTHRFEVEISDDTSGIKKILCNIAGKTYVWELGKTNNSLHKGDGDTWYVDVDTTTIPNGTNHIVLRATDLAGNTRYWNNRKNLHSFIVNN